MQFGPGSHHECGRRDSSNRGANGEWCSNGDHSGRGCGGGAAVSGIVGGVTGAAKGIQKGLSSGSKSTAAAALAIGAIGVAGLVDWPILLAVGGGALLLRKLNRTPEVAAPPVKAKLAPVPDKPAAAKEAPAKASKTTARKTSGRRAGTAELRSTN